MNEEHQFGVGAVDENGLKARGEGATGYPEWIMTKVCSGSDDELDHAVSLTVRVVGYMTRFRILICYCKSYPHFALITLRRE